jgi:putative tryptophan/tyrosine transport system substrate-binding protein
VHARCIRITQVTLVVLAVSALLMGEVSAGERAQPILIGALNSSWGPTPYEAGLRDGLRELGYRENEDFVLGVRFTQGDLTALGGAARQLVAAGANLIAVDHDDAAKAARQATQQIPIVSTSLSDPVEQGLIESFARPGGNLTGISDLHRELGPKRLEVFRAMLPGLKRILFLYSANDAYAAAEAQPLSTAARRLGVELVTRAVTTEEQAQTILGELRKKRIDGVVAPRCCALNLPQLILEATSTLRLPTMYESAYWVERGALASYGPDLYASGRMAARLVDKIIRGSTPAEIPVEINRDVEFAINLRTARALGLTLAPEIVYRANRFIQ